MKRSAPDPKTGMVTLTAENAVEAASLDYISQHVPIFAGSETYGMHAFIAGVKWGLAHKSKSADVFAELETGV